MTAYTDRIKAICGGSLLALYACDDSSAPITDSSGNGRNLTPGGGVTYLQAGIGDGGYSCGFDGTGYTNALTAAWFSGTNGTLAAWAKVSALGDWTDGTGRAILTAYVDGNNWFALRKATTANYAFFARSGAENKDQTIASGSPTTWFQMAMTWTPSAYNFYVNGALVAGPIVRSVAFVGTPGIIISQGGSNWKGNTDGLVVANRALDAAQIGLLARVTVPTITASQEITRTILREGKL